VWCCWSCILDKTKYVMLLISCIICLWLFNLTILFKSMSLFNCTPDIRPYGISCRHLILFNGMWAIAELEHYHESFDSMYERLVTSKFKVKGISYLYNYELKTKYVMLIVSHINIEPLIGTSVRWVTIRCLWMPCYKIF